MTFASVTFLFFFLPASVLFYFLSPSLRLKNLTLLAVSLIFYAWGEPLFVLLMMASILFNFAAAKAIDRRAGPARKMALAGTLAVNLACLALCKYADFLVGTVNGLTGAALPQPHLPLPLGISFFTFHALSYVIDVYRRRFPANPSLAEIALYIALFPQLVAGPIVRYKTIARQFRQRRHTLGRASAGMRIFVIGLAQKVLIADELAALPDAVFGRVPLPGMADAWAATVGYTLQIYFDFAGYSTMAIGLALVFGLRLPRNFDLPYTARSITEFWRRWHISLSTWFRDYLYIPLGGGRAGAFRTYRNLVVVFLLCGLWHGASWAFVLWGALHGAFLVLERLGLGQLLARLPGALAQTYVLLTVMVAWVLFRAEDLAVAWQIWRGMLGLNGVAGVSPQLVAAFHPWHAAVLAAGALLAGGRFRPPRRGTTRGAWSHRLVRAAGELAVPILLFAWATLSVGGQAYRPFLYFRF